MRGRALWFQGSTQGSQLALLAGAPAQGSEGPVPLPHPGKGAGPSADKVTPALFEQGNHTQAGAYTLVRKIDAVR